MQTDYVCFSYNTGNLLGVALPVEFGKFALSPWPHEAKYCVSYLVTIPLPESQALPYYWM